MLLYARPMVVLVWISSPLIVLSLGGNAFGIRRTQDTCDMSAFGDKFRTYARAADRPQTLS